MRSKEKQHFDSNILSSLFSLSEVLCQNYFYIQMHQHHSISSCGLRKTAAAQ